MKKQKTRRLLLLAAACTLCVGGGVVSSSYPLAQAQIIECDTTTLQSLKSEYVLGESLHLPSTKIVYGNQEIEPTETYMILPNGQASRASEYVLEQAGIYTIVYAAKEDGKTLRAEKTFSVAANAYTFQTEDSSIEYKDVLEYVPVEQSGITIKLAQGDTFTYHQPIDLNQNDGALEFITVYPWQRNLYKEGWQDLQQVEQIYIRLTDCYNENVYVEYVLNWQGSMLYYRVATHEQASIGLHSPPPTTVGPIVYLDGAKHYIHTNEWGSSVPAGSHPLQPHGNTLCFDVNTNKAYGTDARGVKHLVNALNSSLLYEEEKFFKGFTTGEVYLSIYGKGWKSAYANIDITQMGGLRGKELDKEKVTDELAPFIEIENGLDEYGKVKIAYGEEYQIPKANAYDFNLVGEVKTAVYLNYGKTSQTRIAAKDGKFTPTRLSTYTVEYTAKDAYGSTTVKTVDLQCVKTQSGLGIDFSVEKLSTLQAGATVELPAHTAVGLNGAVQVTTTYIRFDEDGNEVERAQIQDGAFIPLYTGAYRIVYEYTDGIKSYSYAYETVCNASNRVAMLEEPALPNYLLKGYSYTFDKFYVCTFAGNAPKAELATLQISIDDGAFNSVGYNDVFISANQSVKARYQFGEWLSPVYEMTVVDAGTNGSLKLQELFQGDFQKSSTIEFVSFETQKTGNVVLDFVNVISVSHFNFKYDIPVGYDNFDSLEITLTDYYDKTNKVTITYYKNVDNQTVFNANGKEDLLTVPGFAGNVRNSFYTASTKTLTDTAGVNLKYPISFKGDKAFLSVTLKNVIGTSRINIHEVNNQTFSNLNVDIIEPQITLGKVESGIRQIDSKITLYPATVIDVITPIGAENLTVTVIDPQSNVVKDVNGTAISGLSILEGTYEFVLSRYGEYTIIYTYSDQSTNETLTNFKATVQDQIAPTLNIDGKKVIQAKVGDLIGIADYSVSDNVTATDKITVFVSLLTPKYEMLSIKGNAFKPMYAGTWTVCYYAYDEVGNGCMMSYNVTVE